MDIISLPAADPAAAVDVSSDTGTPVASDISNASMFDAKDFILSLYELSFLLTSKPLKLKWYNG